MERLNWYILGSPPIPLVRLALTPLGDAAVNQRGAKHRRIRVKGRLTARFDNRGPGSGHSLIPALEARRFVAADERVHAVERGLGAGMIGALVGAAALLAGERAAGDLAGEREGIGLGELLQRGRLAPQAGAAPERGAGLPRRDRIGATLGGPARLVAGRRGVAVERGERGEAA